MDGRKLGYIHDNSLFLHTMNYPKNMIWPRDRYAERVESLQIIVLWKIIDRVYDKTSWATEEELIQKYQKIFQNVPPLLLRGILENKYTQKQLAVMGERMFEFGCFLMSSSHLRSLKLLRVRHITHVDCIFPEAENVQIENFTEKHAEKFIQLKNIKKLNIIVSQNCLIEAMIERDKYEGNVSCETLIFTDLDFKQHMPNFERISRIDYLKNIEKLYIQRKGYPISAKALASIPNFCNLRQLHITSAQSSCNNIISFLVNTPSVVKQLEHLDLSCNQINDDFVRVLSTLNFLNLVKLRLEINNLSSTACMYLRHASNNFPKLRYINLAYNTRISDEGCEHLSKLYNLQKVDVRGCQVTEGGISRLQGGLSLRCEIKFI